MYLLLEMGEGERERNIDVREIYRSVASHTPQLGPGPQPRPVP